MILRFNRIFIMLAGITIISYFISFVTIKRSYENRFHLLDQSVWESMLLKVVRTSSKDKSHTAKNVDSKTRLWFRNLTSQREKTFLPFNKSTHNNSDDDVKSAPELNNLKPSIYIVSAYLLRQNFLRVILITDCRSTNRKISASFESGNSTVRTTSKTLEKIVNESCPWEWSPCFYEGMYAEFEFTANFTGDKVSLGVENDGLYSQMVTVHRTLPSSERNHNLSVCMPPLFYYADSVSLIQFIENWLLAGATKFFIYWLAITPEFIQVINIYQKSGIDIEMVAWPHLPDESADFQMYYSGQMISINDCLHRARAQARFAAVVDIDELIYLSSSTSFIDILEKSRENSGGVMLMRTEARFIEQPLVYSSNPKELSFAALEKLYVNEPIRVFKVIVRPENVRRCFVHQVMELELGAESTIVISPVEAVLFHLRPTPSHYFKPRTATTSSALVNIAQKMTLNWQKRIHSVESLAHNLRLSSEVGSQASVVQSCLTDLSEIHSDMCFTVSRCIWIIKKATDIVWQYPEATWIEI